MHLPTCSSPTPSTVLLYNIRDVTRRHTVGSSCPRVKHTIDEYVCTNIPPSHQSVYSLRRPIEYIPCTYPRVPLLHRLQYCYIIFTMQHVDKPSAAVILVSSSQYCSLADVFLSTKSNRITVLPLCTPCSRYYTSTERPQPETLVQSSNRLGCGKEPHTDVFLSLEHKCIFLKLSTTRST